MIPHLYSRRRDSGFPMGCADSVAVDGKSSSNHDVTMYEVNLNIWIVGTPDITTIVGFPIS